jgi:carbamoyl-phosphate synthase large subunit
MRSTGEVLGMAASFGLAYYKSQEAAQQTLPTEGAVLITVSERDRPAVLEVARQFHNLGFKIKATEGTHKFLGEQGIASEQVLKLHEGRPHIVDAIKSREIKLVVNTPSGKLSAHDDSYIRKAAIKYKIPYITTLSGALAAARGIADVRRGWGQVRSLQAYHAGIK